MLDKKYVLKNLEDVTHKLQTRGFLFPKEKFLELENKRKIIQGKTQDLQQKHNQYAKEIAKNPEKIDKIKKEININKENKNTLEKELKEIQEKVNNILINTPNIPDQNIPVGNNEEDNKIIREQGNIPEYNFKVKDHVDLTKDLDFTAGVTLAKSRFVVMKNQIAKLHRALAQFMLDVHTEQHNYMECNVPVLANKETMQGTGQLPKFEDDLFKVNDEKEDLYLIPTAEVPLTNLVKGKKITGDDLPIKLTAHTQCFRKEAGAYGKDTRGIIRQHQFEKVELVQITNKENAEQQLNEVLTEAETILKLLKLPYRVVELCTGDLGFSAQKTYDIEVWIPTQKNYREISSCSWFGDFQARRIGLKCKNNGKNEFLHTINGSGLAVGRTLVAVLENYQDKDGNIIIPDILQPYMQNKKIIKNVL
tara:strand:+ start:5872 stop:7134 length:1263 start_codon:yes stop_codon:yes gene_type:complete